MTSKSKPTNPWFHAKKNDRKYITPEDICAAIHAGAEKSELQQVVLEALGARGCEDWSLCAFVAAYGAHDKKWPT